MRMRVENMIVAVVLAGGVGSRVGAGRPKQFVEILGKPVIAYTLDIFQRNPKVDAIEVVCHKDWREYLDETIAKNNFTKVKWVVDGGATFQESCMNGINHLKNFYLIMTIFLFNTALLHLPVIK